MKKNSTKRALVSSILSLFVCFAMLVGTTFAWFTDTASSDNNIIKTGNLDVAMYYADGALDPATITDWKNAETEAIFTYDNWEPGYIDAKHIKIANEGTLALKYQMRIVANDVVSILADVIDVYYFENAVETKRANFTSAYRLGTLAEVIDLDPTDPNNIVNKVVGTLEADTDKVITLAFKMQESAGNEYQDLSIGSSFSVQILATQFTFENDSFNNEYDTDSTFAAQDIPKANVLALSPAKLANISIAGIPDSHLDTGYSFQPTETYEQVQQSDYRWAHADFYVYADRDVPADSLSLAGYYQLFDGFNWNGETCTSTSWIGLTSAEMIPANTPIRLIKDGMGDIVTVAYDNICDYGNDGIGFLCGAADLTGENAGTTLTVELRVYETACDDTGCHHPTSACETGEYKVIGTFSYTFDGYEIVKVSNATELQNAIDNAVDGQAIKLDSNITGDVVLNQVPGRDVVINGNGKTINGDIIVNGQSAANDDQTVIIENLTFSGGAAGDTYIKLGVSGDTNTRYTKNVTIRNCVFEGDGVVAIESFTGGDKNLRVENCVVEEGMHSLLQVKNVDNVVVYGCKVYSKNGINLNSTCNVTVDNCEFDVLGYAVRFGVNSGGNIEETKNFVIKNSTLKSECQEADDAVIIFRADAVRATLTVENSTVEGTRKVMGNTDETTINGII